MYITNSEKLKRMLSEKGKTIDDLARYIGVNRSTIYRRIQNNSLRIADMQKAAEMLSLSGEEACEIFLTEQSH